VIAQVDLFGEVGGQAAAPIAPRAAAPVAGGGGRGAAGPGVSVGDHGLHATQGVKISEKIPEKTAGAEWQEFRRQFTGAAWERGWQRREKAYYQRLVEAEKACIAQYGDKKPLYRELAKRDLFFLARHVLNYRDVTFRLHYPMCRLVQSGLRRKMFVIPRKHFKTSLVTIAGAIQWVLQDPNGAYFVGTGTPKLVRQVMAELKGHFTHNATFRELFPEFCPDVRTDWGTLESFTVPNRAVVRKEPTVLALSTGAKATGMSFDRAKLDDLVDEENCTTKEQLEAVATWYEFLKFLLKDPAAAVVDMSGTRYHFGDLYAGILESDNLEKGGRFACYVRQAIENGAPIFPERFSLASLEEMRGTDPKQRAVFAAQMMQDPVAEDAQVQRTMIRYHDDGEAQLRESVITLHLDAAISKKDRADYSAFVVCAATPDKELHCIEYTEQRLTAAQFLAELWAFWDKYKALGRIQVITLQNEILEMVLRELLNDQMRARGEYLPLVSIKVHKSKKQERINRILPYVQAGRAKIRRGHTALEDQLLHFPKAKHDDLLDAWSDVIEVVRYPAAREAAAKPAAPERYHGLTAAQVNQARDKAFWDRQDRARRREKIELGAGGFRIVGVAV
jgi:predicted phage terminase large subunit-like protein